VTFGGLNDSVLISGSFDASVRVWDTKSQAMKPIQILNEARDSVAAVIVPKSRPAEIWTGSVDGRVRAYDLRMGKLSTDVVGEPVTSLDATMDGSGILVGTLDGKVRLMDRNSGGCLMAYEGAEGGEYRVKSCFGGAEKCVISGSEADGEVLAWDTVSGKLVERIKVPTVESGKKKLDAFGKEVKRKNVISCVAWKNGGRGKEWCCAGTDGAVTVYGEGP
jgi:mitogen-activated protein kinase organizer 1